MLPPILDHSFHGPVWDKRGPQHLVGHRGRVRLSEPLHDLGTLVRIPVTREYWIGHDLPTDRAEAPIRRLHRVGEILAPCLGLCLHLIPGLVTVLSIPPSL